MKNDLHSADEKAIRHGNAHKARRIVAEKPRVLRVALGFINGKYFATPLERGAAAIMSMVKADGIVDIDRNVEGIDSGEEVRVELLSDLDSIKRKLVIIGSHDVAIDIIGDTIPVVSAHVGSMGGIFAMKTARAILRLFIFLTRKRGNTTSRLSKILRRGNDGDNQRAGAHARTYGASRRR